MLSKLDIVPNYDLSALRLLIVGAAPLTSEIELAVKTRLEDCNPGMDLTISQGRIYNPDMYIGICHFTVDVAICRG